MRRMTGVSLLALTLTISTHAGEMDNGKTSRPPVPTVIATQEAAETKAGEMDSGITATARLFVLNLLQSLLSARI